MAWQHTQLALGGAGDEHLGLAGPHLLFDGHKLDMELICHAGSSSTPDRDEGIAWCTGGIEPSLVGAPARDGTRVGYLSRSRLLLATATVGYLSSQSGEDRVNHDTTPTKRTPRR